MRATAAGAGWRDAVTAAAGRPQARQAAMTSQPAAPDPSGSGAGAGVPRGAGPGAGVRPGRAAATAVGRAGRLIRLGPWAELTGGGQAGPDAAVAAHAAAGLALRRCPLASADRPVLVGDTVPRRP